MKRHLYLYLTILLTIGSFSSCDDDKDSINVNITPVSTLYAPDDNLFVKLQPTTEASVVFEWDRARAEDGTVVLYEVAFDKETGDFSVPVYKVVSDNKGLETKLSLSHKDLNKIANFAGIKSLETGKLKWTVIASKGINVKTSETGRTIEVERPAGFAELPADLYLTGDATEAGVDLANAMKFKQVSPGVFEVYTSLKAGTYQLIDRTSENRKTYSIDGTVIKEDGSTTVTGDSKPYRIKVDFSNAAATVSEVSKVELWFAPDDKFWFDLPYQGNGIWQASNVPVVFKQESWGRDERYKFRFTFKENGTDKYEWFGSSNSDNQRPDANAPAAYWFMYGIPESRWDFSYKFNGAADNKNCDIKVIFQSTATYTHQVIVK
jgi:starch-binding outer membrane protein SusE/F